jgi:hypothetical protein
MNSATTFIGRGGACPRPIVFNCAKGSDMPNGCCQPVAQKQNMLGYNHEGCHHRDTQERQNDYI